VGYQRSVQRRQWLHCHTQKAEESDLARDTRGSERRFAVGPGFESGQQEGTVVREHVFISNDFVRRGLYPFRTDEFQCTHDTACATVRR
jgi:hypothetical protein